MTHDYNVLLDVTGHDMPVPVLQTKEALDKMRAGEVLKVVASKEGAVSNIRMFVKDRPYELISESREGGNYVFHIRKLN